MLWVSGSVLTTIAPGSVAAGLTESISPATSWISLASMARSLARSWLILMNKQIWNHHLIYVLPIFLVLFGGLFYILYTTSNNHEKYFTTQNKRKYWKKICNNSCPLSALEHLSPTYLAISSLCAVQSLIYSSCSLECCFRADRPVGLGVAGAEPPSWATRVEGNGRVWPCLDMWRFEPYSSSEVEAYSTGTRRHRLPADIRKEWKLSWAFSGFIRDFSPKKKKKQLSALAGNNTDESGESEPKP